jgi:hypothetical protein
MVQYDEEATTMSEPIHQPAAPVDYDPAYDAIPDPIRSLTLDGRRIQISPFRNLELAFSSAERHPGWANMVVMGDCPWYWVVSPADASRLERAGYEIVTRSRFIR